METFTDALLSSPLFSGITPDEQKILFETLSTTTRKYSKNEFILHSGDSITKMGFLLSGSAILLKEDFWGNRSILAKLETGDIFAETYACLPNTILGVSVLADETAEVLFLDVRHLLTTRIRDSAPCAKLLQNLLVATAQKNLLLNEKMTHLSRRTTREKLLSYLSAQSMRHHTAEFDIPFNRQQLADYLLVDRSAMSSELCKMRDEGLLEFHKNHFILSDISSIP